MTGTFHGKGWYKTWQRWYISLAVVSVAPSTIKNWCLQYQAYGEAAIEKSLSKTKYSGVFKLSALNYRHVHQLSCREAAEHFNIKQESTITN